MKFLVSPITLVTLLVLSTVPLQAESRAWSNREGKAIQAEFVTYDSETKKVTLKLSNGNKATLALDALSDSDQSWLTDRQSKLDETAAAIRANAGKTASYRSDGPEAVSHHVYYPTSYNPDSPPAMIIMFSPGGGGK
jgi:hypothetical protein